MKLRHAAALALVGWYLMVRPPVRQENWDRTAPTPPLSQWYLRDSFDSAIACQKAKQALIDGNETYETEDYHRWLSGRTPTDALLTKWSRIYNPLAAMKEAESMSQCIATDDPRLKSN